MIEANELDYWVRSHEIKAQGVIAELVGRLVAAAIPNPNDRRFPQGDIINQPGEDGYLDSDIEFSPFIRCEEFAQDQEQADRALRHFCFEGDLKWVSLLMWAGADPRSAGPMFDDDEDDPAGYITAAPRCDILKGFSNPKVGVRVWWNICWN